MPTAPIVGAHFRPPAKALLAAIPGEHPLRIVPEPENERDPEALAVWVRTASLPESCYEELEAQGTGFGYPLEAILAQPYWHLGYIPATSNKKDGPSAWALRSALRRTSTQSCSDAPEPLTCAGKDFWPAKLVFGPDGRSAVALVEG